MNNNTIIKIIFYIVIAIIGICMYGPILIAGGVIFILHCIVAISKKK